VAIGGILNKFDIVIPCHPKDKESLVQAVKSLRNLSKKRKIYIISPDKIDLGIQDEYNYISDSLFDTYFTICEIKKRWLIECPKFAYRSSWIYQQLIKLFCYKVIEDLTESFIFLDSDTMILRDINFDTNKFQFSIPKENHIPYKQSYKYMTGLNAENFSFISHHMMFKKEYLDEMINYIENLHGKKFFEILLDSIDYRIASGFAEQELYGNWVYCKHREICEYRQLKSSDVNYIPSDEQMKTLSQQFDLVSSHAWIRGIEAK
jgi:hypothetical protein